MRRLTMLGLALLLVLAACGTAPLGVCHSRGVWPPAQGYSGTVIVCCASGVQGIRGAAVDGKPHGSYAEKSCETGKRTIEGGHKDGKKCGVWRVFFRGMTQHESHHGPC